MSEKLRVLMLEDSEADAELLAYELRRGGLAFDWKRVETEEDYLAQLQWNPDVILADYNLPRTNAPDALRLLRTQGLTTPFLVVSGFMGEEIAVEMIKEGANDYLLKDRLTRLPSAVAHAVRENQLYREKLEAEEKVRRHEEQLRESQKLEAVGRLAGGIAHDFNNLLQVIIGDCELLNGDLGVDNPLSPRVEQIRKTAFHAARLVSQLLAFGRKQMLRPQLLDLNSIVSEGSAMLRRLIPENIELSTELCADLASIEADSTQIMQVLINLVTNACDAMPSGGAVKIATRNVRLEPDLKNYCLLEVMDTGSGMDESTKAHIFEPFFTTKEASGVGKGTGLGLATVYGIVKQSGGDICVDSQIGRGSTFRVYLPQAEGKAAPKQNVLECPEGSSMKATILLVEDSEALREIMRQGLELAHYDVLVAADGAAALEIALRHPKPIHVLVTDVMMRNLRGTELAVELCKSRPDTKVIYISGYSDDILAGAPVPGVFIQKPVELQVLRRKIADLLAARSPMNDDNRFNLVHAT